jgi:CRISPR-associated protein Cas1
MPTACVLQPDSQIRLKSERLEVWGKDPDSGVDRVLRQVPIRDVDRLILAETVQITSQAVAALLRSNIPVNMLGWNGQFLGGFLPATNAHGLARLRQYERTFDKAFALQMAGRIVTAKLYNQRRVLQRLAASRKESLRQTNDSGVAVNPPDQDPGSAVPDPASSHADATLVWLENLFGSISRSQTVDELRGYEGAAAARYFQCWGEFLPAQFPFERRSTRPPLNPVNACISFGATLLYHETVAFLHAHGLDPALGLLHRTEDGRWSLALDLVEPFRPVMVEALALDLFSHQMLNEKHFEPRNGGVYLNDEGRRKFILQYERRMERQFMSECAGHRTCLRQQLENQVVMFKAALETPPKFQPFLMN